LSVLSELFVNRQDHNERRAGAGNKAAASTIVDRA